MKNKWDIIKNQEISSISFQEFMKICTGDACPPFYNKKNYELSDDPNYVGLFYKECINSKDNTHGFIISYRDRNNNVKEIYDLYNIDNEYKAKKMAEDAMFLIKIGIDLFLIEIGIDFLKKENKCQK